VWAINEGRQCARMVDRYLAGLPGEDERDHFSSGTSIVDHTRDGAAPPDQATWGSGAGITD
jgi:glutamate synthase (NADPH) small chain